VTPEGTGERRERFQVEEPGGERLDVYLARKLELSRSRAVALVAEGRVLLDGELPRKASVVEAGAVVEVVVPPPAALEARPEAIPLELVYEDRFLLVVNKPAGLVVHPAPGHPGGTLVNALLHHVTDLSGIGGALRPGIVHRLDRDTSGLMVVAKTDLAHRFLSDAMKARTVRRRYLAAAWGHLPERSVTVDAPIGRDPRDRKRMAVVPGGRRAVTRFRVLERWAGADLLGAALHTGRTHQIRVHLLHLGHPVVGDPVYGGGGEGRLGAEFRGWAHGLTRRASRQFLHAAELVFRHPDTGEEMRFQAPLPEDLRGAADWARSHPDPRLTAL